MQRYRPRRVLAYARVSSTAQDERGTSLEAQQEEFARHCASHGFPKPRLYIEVEGGGAEKLERRHELHRLLADVAEGDLVLCTKQDRWSRYTKFYLESIEQIIAKGARFFSIAERFDPSTPEGKFASTLMASAAELEHARIRDRTVGARQRLRAMGKHVEGPAPFGYAVDKAKRTIIIDEATAEVVRFMFAQCVAGRSTRQIATAVQAKWKGIRGCDPSAVQRKLRNRVYLGEMRSAAKKNVRPKKDDPWLKGTHPPIVTARTFNAAERALAKRRLTGRPAGAESRTASFLLRGIVRCGHCGYVLKSHAPSAGSTKHGGWYMCRRRPPHEKGCTFGPCVRHAELDAAVEAEMLTHLAELAVELSKARKPQDPAGLPDYEERRDAILERRRRLWAAIEKHGSDEESDAAVERVRADLDALERLREEAERHEPMTPTDRRRELSVIKALRAAWGRLTIAEQRTEIARHAVRLAVYSTGKGRWQREGTWRLVAQWKQI
jgi:DNA invertase Pin-like site-specific DNA recombinase